MRPVDPTEFQGMWSLALDNPPYTEPIIKQGFIIAFWETEPLIRYNSVPERAPIGPDKDKNFVPDISYWENLRPIEAYVFWDISNRWDDFLLCFDNIEELHSWMNENIYDGEQKVYAEKPKFFLRGTGVYMLKNTIMPVVPQGATICTIMTGGDLHINSLTNPTLYPYTANPSRTQKRMYIWPVSPGTHPHLIFTQVEDYRILAPEGYPPSLPHWRKWYHKRKIYDSFGEEWDDYVGPAAYSEAHCITAEGWPCADPVPDEAHAPEHLDEVWPGTYKDGDSTWEQLCTKDELDPEHEGEWLEPSEGGQYSYTGPWDSHCLYVVGEDWDGNVKPYFSQISEDALHTWRRQIDGETLFDHTARFLPPSTSRGWGAKARYKFGLDTNKTPFGLERPNIMISQDGKYNLEKPEWALTDGYKKLIDDDLAEVSLPHTWGKPRNSQGERDWDCIYPASWYMLYKTMFFSNRTSYDLHNSLFVVCNQYPGERVLERNPDAEDLGFEPTITEWKWPEEEPREFGDEVVPKHDRLGLTNYPWIPCVLGIAAGHYASVRTGKLPLLEEQENVYVDEASREDENPYWPADRTVTYCDEINMMGVVFDSEFFQGTQPPTADSLHHAPDMSDFVTDSTWFDPSKVFGRTKTDRQFAYLPPCAFDMNFIIGGTTSTRVFYPTRKGVISATYTSKSKRVLQEVSDYYMAEGECVLSYVSPTRKAYTAERGDENSRNRATIVSAVYSSQSLVNSVCDQLETSAIAKVNYNWTVPFTTDITNYLIPGVDNVLINLNSETISISGKFRG